MNSSRNSNDRSTHETVKEWTARHVRLGSMPVKNLVDASLVAYARLFRFERDRQRSVTLLDDRVTGTFIMTVELSALQSALVDLLDGLDTFTRLAVAEIAAQDAEVDKPTPWEEACLLRKHVIDKHFGPGFAKSIHREPKP